MAFGNVLNNFQKLLVPLKLTNLKLDNIIAENTKRLVKVLS